MTMSFFSHDTPTDSPDMTNILSAVGKNVKSKKKQQQIQFVGNNSRSTIDDEKSKAGWRSRRKSSNKKLLCASIFFFFCYPQCERMNPHSAELEEKLCEYGKSVSASCGNFQICMHACRNPANDSTLSGARVNVERRWWCEKLRN